MSDIGAETLALARQLLACPSVTPNDAGTMALIESRLRAAGFVCERLDREGVANLWAHLGTAAPLVCFAGHVDVVPAGPEARWSAPPFDGTVRDGWLIGRGAADMKASVAAMVTAAERMARSGEQRGTLALLLTADEEGDARHGTVAVVDELHARGTRIDYCLLGEPTSSERFGDTLKNGRRGSLSGHLRVRGIQCHVAYPERGRNPVHQALPALQELVATVWDDGDAFFSPTTFQVSHVHAGTGAPNVVPGEFEVQFNLRFSPALTPDGIRDRVHAVLDRHGIEYELEWTLSAEPFVTQTGRLVDAVRDAVATVVGTTPQLSTSGGTSDGRFLKAVADELIEFGPMNDTIHKIDERIAVADLAPLSSIYERVARQLLNGLPGVQ